jgi:hypothetical protein
VCKSASHSDVFVNSIRPHSHALGFPPAQSSPSAVSFLAVSRVISSPAQSSPSAVSCCSGALTGVCLQEARLHQSKERQSPHTHQARNL